MTFDIETIIINLENEQTKLVSYLICDCTETNKSKQQSEAYI